ncbi:AAA family ATPase [Sphingomonas cannabina]|uniref:bifunctional aminoglycoside phosphotransferase/ATP-binding protein n=1 Tax=Sphingomonas cannabina TaxID=2899123 RepID=UPI001F2D3FC6|nr:AAA family ATPase [Sphingomonas cannabina]UIJ46329.1 AAA family ATPase [Sphingomonas cannabina]
MTSSAARTERPAAEEVVGFLEESGVLGADPVRRVDTHAAHVFLAGDRAWKLKRPVRLDYLDFSTPARRKAALAAELRLNRRTAPGLYVGLHAITREPDGCLALDGEGAAVDWLLEMRRFADDVLLDHRARRGGLDEGLMIALADAVHTFHVAAEIASSSGGAERLGAVIAGNAKSFAAYAGMFDSEAVAKLLARQRAALTRQSALLDARARAGRVRHCHGDLHLANIALIDDVPVPFDCLEFDAELATTDVLYDLAFLLMDLWHRGLRREANRLFNRYLDLSAEDEDGVALMPLLLSIRAAVRAHVAAARARRGGGGAAIRQARSYLALAASLLDPVPLLLLAIGGRSGTGKSTLARTLAADIGAAPGARILRSDVVRKRLAGLAPEARIPAADYTAAASVRVYAALDSACRDRLAEGGSVIADAAFLDPRERGAIAEAAASAGARFVGLWLEAGLAVRIARVSGREGDASDANARVVRLQARRPVGSLRGWRRLAAGGPPARIAASARRFLARSA